MFIRFWLIMIFMLTVLSALSDSLPKNEYRYQTLSKELRCLVCQNESLADSDAPLAKDLRQTIQNKIAHGESDKQIIHFLTTRYGEFILFKPTFSKKNSLLWFGPALIFFIGLIILWFNIKKNQQSVQKKLTLSETEKNKLEQLLK